MSTLDFTARALALRLERDLATRLILIPTFADARSKARVIPAGTETVQTAGHQIEGLGGARYNTRDPMTGLAIDAAFIAANPLTSFRAVDEDNKSRYFALAEEVPDASQFGLVAGVNDQGLANTLDALVDLDKLPAFLRGLIPFASARSPAEQQGALNAMEAWVATRSRRCTIEDQGRPVILEEPWLPQSGNHVTVNAQIVNVTQNVSYVGQGACVKLGEGHPAYWSPTNPGAQATFWLLETPSPGSNVTLADTGSNRADALAELAVGDGIHAISKDRYYIGAGGHHRYDIVHTARITSIDAATGLITLDDPLDEVRGSFEICKAVQPTISVGTSPFTMWTLFDYRLSGRGSLISVTDPLSRPAAKRLDIDLSLLFGETCFFLGQMFDSRIRFEIASAQHTMMDAAGNCTNCEFGARVLYFRGSGETNRTACVLNEQSRNVVLKAQAFIAPDYDASYLMRFASVRYCGFQIDRIFAPSVTASILIEEGIQPGAGETMPLIEANWFDLGRVECGTPTRFFDSNLADSSGFEMRRGTFYGEATQPVRIASKNGKISPLVRFESQAIELQAGASGWNIKGAYIADGISENGGKIADNDVQGVISKTWEQLRAQKVDSTSHLTISATAAGTPFAGITIPPDTLRPGDRISVFASGRAAAGGGTKTISISDDEGEVSSLTVPSGAKGWRLEGELAVQAPTNIALTGTISTDTSIKTFEVRRTGLNLAAASRSILLDCYKAVASDSLFVYSNRLVPQRVGHG